MKLRLAKKVYAARFIGNLRSVDRAVLKMARYAHRIGARVERVRAKQCIYITIYWYTDDAVGSTYTYYTG